MNLSDMRTRVRRDLHDEDSASYRWTDAELDRHIGRALRELGQAIPRERQSALATVAGSPDIGISSLTDRIGVTAVEWPTGKYPPVYVRFSVWVDTLTMLVDSPPAAVENVNFYWLSLHTLDATTSTLPAWAEAPITAILWGLKKFSNIGSIRDVYKFHRRDAESAEN